MTGTRAAMYVIKSISPQVKTNYAIHGECCVRTNVFYRIYVSFYESILFLIVKPSNSLVEVAFVYSSTQTVQTKKMVINIKYDDSESKV